MPQSCSGKCQIFRIEGRAARPNFDPTKDSRFFCVFPFYAPSLPVCATLKTFVHVQLSNPFCTYRAPLPSPSEPTKYIIWPCRILQNSLGIHIKRRKDVSVLQAKFCMGRLCLCHCQRFPKFNQARNCCKIIAHNSGIKLHQMWPAKKSLLVGLHGATENDGAW
jgi:hypothetical protein